MEVSYLGRLPVLYDDPLIEGLTHDLMGDHGHITFTTEYTRPNFSFTFIIIVAFQFTLSFNVSNAVATPHAELRRSTRSLSNQDCFDVVKE